MKKVLTVLAAALFLGACYCTQCTKTACHMNKQAKCTCAEHKEGCKCAKHHKEGCKCAECKKHHGKDCPCAHQHKQAAKPAPAPKPVAKKVAEDKDLATVGKVKTKADNTAVFSFDKPINFKVNSDQIQGTSPADIKQAAKALKKYPNAQVRVVGYSDSIGDPAYNLALSARRAKAVADELIKDGVSPANVSYVGKGESDPIAPNKTAEGRAKNRRVELEISNK